MYFFFLSFFSYKYMNMVYYVNIFKWNMVYYVNIFKWNMMHYVRILVLNCFCFIILC